MTPTRTARRGDQQMPHPGQIDVGPLVVKDVLSYSDFRDAALVLSVAEDFRARIALGIERYGHPLQTHNGRDAAEDAYQECLDAAHYLKQLHLETHAPKIWLAYGNALSLVFELKDFMAQRPAAANGGPG